MGLTPKATNFFFWVILVCQAFLGDLILKGEKFGSKQGENEYIAKGKQLCFQRGRNLDQSKVKMIIFPIGSNFDSKGGEKKKKTGRNKGA